MQDEQADPELRHEHGKLDATWNARYRRLQEYRGKEPNGKFEQEKFLQHARRYAAARLDGIIAELPRDEFGEADLELELKRRIAFDAWDNYLPRSPSKRYIFLEFDEFSEALWTEGSSSLEDKARAAIQQRAVTEDVGLRKIQRSQREAAGPVLPKLSLKAHRKDQERRKNAKQDLGDALANYFSALAGFKDVNITKLAEIVGAYACEIYDSTAEGYLAIPSLDPEALFGMAGPLNVGPTLVDVQKCLSTLRVRRPWKISSDPVVCLLDDGHELMGIHYEHPWFKQEIGDIVTRHVQDARKKYEEGFQFPPKAHSSGTTHVNDWESLQSGFRQLRADCAINPPINPAGRLIAIWTVQPEPGTWRLSYWDAKDGAGIKERFTWHAYEAAALMGYLKDGDDALSYWLDQVKLYAPKQYVRRIVSAEGPDGSDQLYSMEILDICGLSAEFCRKCKADAIRSRANPEGNLQSRTDARAGGAEEGFSEPQRSAVEQPAARPNRDNHEDTNAASWDAIEISFLSDERVQIRNGSNTETRNYAELGFEDRRNETPSKAWNVLRIMAEQKGIISGPAVDVPWPKMERRVQEIRKALKKHFSITTDPIPLVPGTGYQACFKIGCSRSYGT